MRLPSGSCPPATTLGPDGSPLGAFRPDDEINRAEVAKIIALAKEVLRYSIG